ncbi:MAG: Hint domain-containing protein [Pseudomonadota bacterium]
MPFTDVINNYTNGATGTLTDVNGDPVGYTVSGTSPNTNWNGLTGGARVNANQTQSFTVTFDDPVVGAVIQMSGSDANEIYYVEVDGVTVDLQDLIDNGDVVFNQSGASTHQIGTDGSIFGGHYSDGSIAELTFLIPVTSLGAYGTNGNSGNWDYFEVGIDSTIFDVVCFTQGTQIDTPLGRIAIEKLSVGDLVTTAHHGPQPVRWIGTRMIPSQQLTSAPKLRPVRIMQGALGDGHPKRDLRVSRQHRLVVSSRIAHRMFDTRDVMIPAIKLTSLPGIFVDRADDPVCYVHLLFDRHEVIFSEGCPSESLFLGPGACSALSPDARAEIETLFPGLLAQHQESQPILPVPTGKLQKKLVQRHIKNNQPIL